MFHSRPALNFMRCMFLLTLFASAVGLSAQAQSGGRALIPDKYRSFTSAQLNAEGLTVHKAKDFDASALFFWYATLAAPKEARGHFNLACSFARKGWPWYLEASIQELRRALELDRKWTVANIDDTDLTNLRWEAGYSELMLWLTGGLGVPTGTWTARDVGPDSLPSWLKPDELAGAAYSVSFMPKGVLGVTAAAGYTLEGSYDLRGTVLSWRGLMSVQSPEGEETVRPVGGIMQARLLTPRILELKRLLGSEGLPEGVLLLSGS